MFSKKRTLIIGGLPIEITIKRGEVVNSTIYGKKFKGTNKLNFDPGFIKFIEKYDEILNLNNTALYGKGRAIDNLLQNQIKLISDDINTIYVTYKITKDKKSMLKLLNSGTMDEDMVDEAVAFLNKPIGIKGLISNLAGKIISFGEKMKNKMTGAQYSNDYFKRNHSKDHSSKPENDKESNEEDKKKEIKEITESNKEVQNNDKIADVLASLTKTIEDLNKNLNDNQRAIPVGTDKKQAKNNSSKTQKKEPVNKKAGSQNSVKNNNSETKKTNTHRDLQIASNECREMFKNTKVMKSTDYKSLGDFKNELSEQIASNKINEVEAINKLKNYANNTINTKLGTNSTEKKKTQSSNTKPRNKIHQKDPADLDLSDINHEISSIRNETEVNDEIYHFLDSQQDINSDLGHEELLEQFNRQYKEDEQSKQVSPEHNSQ